MHISDGAKELICLLLQVNPQDRYTARQALKHKLFLDEFPCVVSCMSPTQDFESSLCSFPLELKLKKAVNGFEKIFGVYSDSMDFQTHALDSPVDSEDAQSSVMEVASEASDQDENLSTCSSLADTSYDMSCWPGDVAGVTQECPIILPWL